MEIFSTFHARVEYNTSLRPFKPMRLSAHRRTQTHIHTSENIMSASFTALKWRIPKKNDEVNFVYYEHQLFIFLLSVPLL